MKNSAIFFLLSVFFGAGCFGQDQTTGPIPVTVNAHTTLTLFFPSPISRTIAPAANFEFNYGNDAPQMGHLRGSQGKPSNLTVISEDGYIYSFALQYSEKIETFTLILTPGMAVGRLPQSHSRTVDMPSSELGHKASQQTLETSGLESLDSSGPEPSDMVSLTDGTIDAGIHFYPERSYAGEADLYNSDREEYYRIFCENNYLQKTIFMRTFRQNKKIVLKLNNILVDREEIYFVLQVENNSREEYHVNGLSFFRKSGVGQLQKIMKPRYVFNLQDKIDPHGINEVVLVFKRFTLSGKEEVYVVLDELETDRMVLLPLDNKQINAPTN